MKRKKEEVDVYIVVLVQSKHWIALRKDVPNLPAIVIGNHQSCKNWVRKHPIPTFKPEINYVQTEKAWTIRPPTKLVGTYLAGEEPAQRATKHVSNGDRPIWRSLYADGAIGE